eukprot:CAMPEP_0196147124 /NCGR_PEP_ID=MMETSP0910-20130528/24656_1 /TAXON_ID=49265 /ORGANISM="Thalassiosira rotula, Strain GSO102" /LENGTH=1134 /DNA_ID=CAMNT_0041409473 /DNA_START=265 /DNA_END=3668 /DNA_ORIENTATION=+
MPRKITTPPFHPPDPPSTTVDDVNPPKAKSSGDARKRPIPTGFRPIDPKADHGYRINVARDGSMITAVPIEEQPLRDVGVGGSNFKAPQRSLRDASPILFSQPRSSPNGTSSNSSTTWSQQGLLDARGKQRHKMKRLKPKPKSNATAAAATTKKSPKIISDHDSFPNDPFNNVVHTARDKLKHAKGFLAFTGTNHNSAQRQQQPRQESGEKPPTTASTTQPKQQQTRSRSRSKSKKPKVTWDLSPKLPHNQQPQSQQYQIGISSNFDDADASFSSFPLLSGHKFGDSVVGDEERVEKEKEEKKEDEEKTRKNDNSADSRIENDANKEKGRDDTNANVIPEQEGSTQTFEALLQHRVAEIQSQQHDLAQKMSKKDVIKGTLITAIDGNLERNRKKMKALEVELKRLEWHLKLDSKKKQKHHMTDVNNIETRNSEEVFVSDRPPRSPNGAYDMDSVDVGDPSITADTDSVAALFLKENAAKATSRLDPPARPSPPSIKEESDPPYKRERKEPDGPRISTVLRGNNNVVHAGVTKSANRNNKSRVVVDPPTRISSPPSTRSLPPSPKSAPFRPVPLQHYQQMQAPRQRNHHPWEKKKSSMLPPQSQKRDKFVHFNLPQDSYSEELKFETTNSTDSPSPDFVDVTNENGGEEDISWNEEHFDVQAYDAETGSVISSEHHDLYHWKDKEHHIVVSEHYSRENHHRHHHHGGTEDEIESQPINHNNYNRGVSSDSVETDPDLGFIHTVAAVVIQTAVRRFLAEIAVEERHYAVNVIQTAICNWMAHIKRNPYFDSYEIFHDDQNAEVIIHDQSLDTRISENPSTDRAILNKEYSDAIANDDQNLGRITHDEQNHHSSFRQRPPQRTKRVMFEDDYKDYLKFCATEIQRCYRGWWARDGIEVDHFAASTIQRVFRGWWTREALDVDRYCAVEIQRIVRGHLSRMSYIYDLYCIIVVQSVVRRYLAFYTSAVRLANILYIQAMFRGYRVRSELMRYVRNGQEVAATFIQSQWRSYDTHMNYINTLADILIVQSVARRWLTIRKLRRRIKRKPRYDDMGYGYPSANYNRRNHVPVAPQRNKNASRQQHRLNVASSPVVDQEQYSHQKNTNTVHQDSAGGEAWYDGNKSETSDMLKSWKGRKSP